MTGHAYIQRLLLRPARTMASVSEPKVILDDRRYKSPTVENKE
jgi:hypothetical protein